MPSTEWKRQVMKDKWYAGETISVAIGQGQVNVTPLSLAVMMMTLANGGTRYTPHVLKAIDEGKGWKPVPAPPPLSTAPMKPSTVQAIHDGLWLAVNGAGTAGRARIAGRDVSGKTGTAQVISLTGAKAAQGKIDVRDHGWFVFFAPRDNPELAGVIFAEHAEHGYYGASIAKHIIETYYAKKEGRPLPVLEKPAAPGTVIAAIRRRRPHRRSADDQRTGRRSWREAVTQRPSRLQMFERRLFFHVDWLLLGAVLLLAGDRRGDDLQHDLRAAARRHRPCRAASSGRSSTRSALGVVALLDLPDHRLPHRWPSIR